MSSTRRVNPILECDSYKLCHAQLYPENVAYATSYFVSRGGEYTAQFFGLQMILEDFLSERITMSDVVEATDFAKDHGEPFDAQPWWRIARDMGGRLPLEIKALPEGSRAATGEIMFLVRNTVPGFGFLVSWAETKLERVWYPTAVSSRSRRFREVVDYYTERTSDVPFLANFRVHDFGGRGVEPGAAGYGGAAHLVNFMGSDTIEGILAARDFYGEPMAGFSVPATEHSVMTMYGEDREIEAFEKTIRLFGGEGKIVSIVSDSYSTARVLDEYMPALKDLIVSSGTRVVVRLDSGDPLYWVRTALNSLEATFGATVNSKGYKVLNHVGILQGDAVTEETFGIILDKMEADGWSIDNIVFGVGGFLLQKLNRDTLKIAYKACEATLDDGTVVPVFKRSEDAFKTSKPLAELDQSRLLTVWRDGELLKRWTFAEVRETAAKAA